MNKKFIAPIIIGILLCIYYIGIIFVMLSVGFNGIFCIMLVLGLIAIIAILVYVVRERIHEIKGGEEDDISKY